MSSPCLLLLCLSQSLDFGCGVDLLGLPADLQEDALISCVSYNTTDRFDVECFPLDESTQQQQQQQGPTSVAGLTITDANGAPLSSTGAVDFYLFYGSIDSGGDEGVGTDSECSSSGRVLQTGGVQCSSYASSSNTWEQESCTEV